MNWDALGAIGELVSAFAVVVTLLYLAIQLRQTRIAAVRDANRTIITDFQRIWTDALRAIPGTVSDGSPIVFKLDK